MDQPRPAIDYKLLLESTGEGLYCLDREGRCTFANRAAGELLGYAEGELLGRRMHEAIHHHRAAGSSYPAEECPIVGVLRTGRECQVEGEVLWRRDGSSFAAEYSSSPMVEGGVVTGAVVSFRDVSARRATEAALRESEEQYRNLLEQAADGITLSDQRGRFLLANQRMCDLLGYTAEELRRLTLLDVVPPEDLVARPLRVEELRAGKTLLNERRLRRKDGELVAVETSTKLLADGRVQYIIRDIAERQRAEAALRESEARNRALLAAIPDVMFRIRGDGTLLDYKAPRAGDLYAPPEAFIGRRLDEALPPAVAERGLRGVALALATGEPQSYDYELAMPGGPRAFEARLVVSGPDEVLAIVRDITEEQRAQEALRFLAEASTLLASSLDYERTLASVTRLATPGFADWCGVDVLDEDEAPRRVAVAHANPDKADLARALQRSHRPHPDGILLRVLRGGRAELFPEVPATLRGMASSDAERGQQLADMDPRSLMIVPLVARGRTLGAIFFAVTESARRYGPADLALAEDLAGRMAVAIDNALLYREARAAVRGKDESLALLDTLLASAPVGLAFIDRECRFARINERLAAENGRSVAEHLGKPLREINPAFANSAEPLVRRVLETGEPIINLEISGRARTARWLRHWLVSYYPVRGRDGALTGVGVVVTEISSRRRAEDAQRFLAEASRVLAASLDYETTLSSIVRVAVPTFATWCSADMLGEGGEIRPLAVAHDDPEKLPLLSELRRRYPIDPRGSHPIARVLRTGRAALLADVPDETLRAVGDEEYIARLRAVGFESTIVVPLVAQGHTLGTLRFVSGESGRHYDEDDLALAENLAQRCALAVENARLYREARDAISLRDQFLSIASHELRTPVTGVKGYAELLQRQLARGVVDAEKQARYLRAITLASNRLDALTTDLLDVSRMHMGQLRLRPVRFDLAAHAREVADRYADRLDEGHALAVETPDGPAPILADPDRLEQVLTNLLDNAVKYSPDGGRVLVTVRPDDGGAALAVRDEGIGLPPGQAELIFTPFGRASNALDRQAPGLGLGLYICQDIVTRLGGRIRAESAGEGRGTTIIVWLPADGGEGDGRGPGG